MYIVLEFDKELHALADYNYGKKVYKDQVLGKLDLVSDTSNCTIIFPECIDCVAISFIEGFYYGMRVLDNISLYNMLFNVKIQGNEHLEKDFKDYLTSINKEMAHEFESRQ